MVSECGFLKDCFNASEQLLTCDCMQGDQEEMLDIGRQLSAPGELTGLERKQEINFPR